MAGWIGRQTGVILKDTVWWYLYAAVLVLVLVGISSLAFYISDEGFLVPALITLAAGLVTLLVGRLLYRPLFWIGVFVAWLGATALVIERGAAVGINGWLVAGLWLVASIVALVVAIRATSERRFIAEQRRIRAAALEAHRGFLLDRQRMADRAGMEYQPNAAVLADGFGRLVQPLPERVPAPRRPSAPERQEESVRVLAAHAAGLEAEAVVRSDDMGFPVIAFDLEVIDYGAVLNPDNDHVGLSAEEYAEAWKKYLTVLMVTLAVPLPFVSSTFAFELANLAEGPDRWEGKLSVGPEVGWLANGPGAGPATDEPRDAEPRDAEELRRRRIGMLTENEEFARFLMSVPQVWQAALSTMLFIDGDRLVVSAMSDAGTPADGLDGAMARLAALAQALPWPELERYRADSPDDWLARSRRFYRSYAEGFDSSPDPLVFRRLERWEEGSTSSGVRLFQRTQVLTWYDESRPAGGRA